VTLLDGRPRDLAEAERTAAAELLGGGGRGFVLLRQQSAVSDWHDAEQVQAVFYREIEQLIERILPGVRTLTPNKYAIRTEEPERFPVQPSPAAGFSVVPVAAGVCHNDFAENHGQDLVDRPNNDVTQQMLDEHRLLEISCWRNIDSAPIERMPLAICDRSSLHRDDLLVLPKVVGDPTKEGGGWADIYFARHREGQRWLFIPEMRVDEVLLLLQYDSRPEVPHRPLTELEKREGGKGLIPPLHSPVDLPGSERGARRKQ